MAIRYDQNQLELISPPLQEGLAFRIKSGASGTTALEGDQDPISKRDDLYENAQTGLLTINFDGKSGVDSIYLDEGATNRVLKGRITNSTAFGAPATWVLQSTFAAGQSTINGTNIEWVGSNNRWSSLYLGALYLQLNKITTETVFEIDPTNTSGVHSLAASALTETDTVSTFGRANDIFYEAYRSNHTYLMGDGNDLVSSYTSTNSFDGGNGVDTYVLSGMERWEFTTAPTSFEASYTVNSRGQVEIDIDPQSGFAYRAATLSNFEILIFSDRMVRITTAAATGSAVQGTIGSYNVILGRNNADTLTGVTAGDTLQGGNGNDLLIAASTASPMARMATNERNLLINGSFEINNAIDRRWNYSRRLEGWTSLVGTPTNFSAGGTMEIWKNFSAVRATDGSCLLELDSNNQVNGIEQRVQTVANQSYQLTLDFSARLNAAGRGNPRSRNGDTFSIYWNDTKLGDFTNRKTTWQQISLTVTGTGGVDALRFFEAPSQNDEHGVLLDNVKLIAVGSNPEFSTNVLNGGAGRDTLVGSAAIDRFFFEAGGSGSSLATADVIRQFTSGVDLIDISELTQGDSISLVSALTGQSGNYEVVTRAETLAGRQGLLASFDFLRDGVADYAIFLEGINSLTVKDFKTSTI